MKKPRSAKSERGESQTMVRSVALRAASRGDPSAWKKARRILVFRCDGVSQVLLSTPALRALKESGSGRSLTLLTTRSAENVARLIPEVDEVLPAETANFGNPFQAEAALKTLLRSARFEGAVVLAGYDRDPRAALRLCHEIGIPLQLAYGREDPGELLTDWVPETEPEDGVRHEARRQLDLVRNIGCTPSHERLSVRVTPESRTRSLQLLAESGVTMHRPVIVIHPGARAAARRYPAVLYAEVARDLIRTAEAQIVFTGTSAERDLVQSLVAAVGPGSSSLCGRLEVADLAALLSLVPVLITNNGFPAHLSAAVGTPVVSLYALTHPQQTPWNIPNRVLYHDVPCKYCGLDECAPRHLDCLRKVPPQRVVKAACDLMTMTPAAEVGVPNLAPGWWAVRPEGGNAARAF